MVQQTPALDINNAFHADDGDITADILVALQQYSIHKESIKRDEDCSCSCYVHRLKGKTCCEVLNALFGIVHALLTSCLRVRDMEGTVREMSQCAPYYAQVQMTML